MEKVSRSSKGNFTVFRSGRWRHHLVRSQSVAARGEALMKEAVSGNQQPNRSSSRLIVGKSSWSERRQQPLLFLLRLRPPSRVDHHSSINLSFSPQAGSHSSAQPLRESDSRECEKQSTVGNRRRCVRAAFRRTTLVCAAPLEASDG